MRRRIRTFGNVHSGLQLVSAAALLCACHGAATVVEAEPDGGGASQTNQGINDNTGTSNSANNSSSGQGDAGVTQLDGSDPLPVSVDCADNSDGTSRCTCLQGEETVDCEVQDECEDGTALCHEYATCTDKADGYSCECIAGYTGDGIDCENIDECALETDDCGEMEDCTDTLGSFTCTCKLGYYGDDCSMEDECILGTNDCDATYGTCTDTGEAFACGCAAGTVEQEDGSCLPSSCTVARIYGSDTSGTVTIDRGDGPASASCDQDADGGGWMLVLNYVHLAGTQPLISVESVLPVMNSDTLGDDESTVDSAWGHIDNATFFSLQAVELRFAGRTSYYNPLRPVDFVTAHAPCINYFGTGLGTCAEVHSDPSTRTLSGHSPDSNLPFGAVAGGSNQGDLAMTNGTLFVGGFEADGGTRWNVGVYASETFPARMWDVGNGYTDSGKTYVYNTIHRIWVRSAFPADCEEIVDGGYFRGQMLYTLDSDEAGGASPHTVECNALGKAVTSPYASCEDVAAANIDANDGDYYLDADGAGGEPAALTGCEF